LAEEEGVTKVRIELNTLLNRFVSNPPDNADTGHRRLYVVVSMVLKGFASRLFFTAVHLAP